MQEIIGNLIYDFGDLVGLGEMIFPILMGLFLFFLLFIGFPVAIALATSGFLFALIFWDPYPPPPPTHRIFLGAPPGL